MNTTIINKQGQSTSKSQPISEKIRNVIAKTQQELEEFILQLSLGKADASVKYEEMKKEFRKKISEWKLTVSKLKKISKQEILDMKSKLEELELQLTLGKAEAMDAFSEQKKKITKVLHQLEDVAKNNPELKDSIRDFENEIEKFKLKLEILAVKFEMKKIIVSDDFKKAMLSTKVKIDKYFTGLEQRMETAKLKYSDFSNEIKMSYNHLREAINRNFKN